MYLNSDNNNKSTVEYYGAHNVKETGLRLVANGRPDKNKFWIGLDWVDLNFTGNPKVFNENRGDFEISLTEYKSQIFKNIYEVTYRGDKFAEVRCEPYSKIVDPLLIQVKIFNVHLYVNTYLFWELASLISYYELDFKGVGRLDIAIDFNTLSDLTPAQLFVYVANGSLQNRGRANMQPYFRAKGFQVTGFSVGSKSSKSKYVRCYNKTLEMEVNDKEHIRSLWENFGLNNGDVWRFELMLKSRFFSECINEDGTPIHWEQLFSGHIISRILRIALKNYFDFALVEKYTHKRNWKTFEFIPYPQISGIFNYETAKLIKLKRNSLKGSIRSRRILLKGMLRSYYELGQNPLYAGLISQYLEDYDLYDYFKLKFSMWLKEFKRDSLTENLFDYDLYLTHFDHVC